MGTANPVQDYDTLIRNSDPQAFLNGTILILRVFVEVAQFLHLVLFKQVSNQVSRPEINPESKQNSSKRSDKEIGNLTNN